jgi:hypothetical protein
LKRHQGPLPVADIRFRQLYITVKAAASKTPPSLGTAEGQKPEQ